MGTQIQVRLSGITNGQCNFGCSWNGIELKIKSDKRLTSPRWTYLIHAISVIINISLDGVALSLLTKS